MSSWIVGTGENFRLDDGNPLYVRSMATWFMPQSLFWKLNENHYGNRLWKPKEIKVLLRLNRTVLMKMIILYDYGLLESRFDKYRLKHFEPRTSIKYPCEKIMKELHTWI